MKIQILEYGDKVKFNNETCEVIEVFNPLEMIEIANMKEQKIYHVHPLEVKKI